MRIEGVSLLRILQGAYWDHEKRRFRTREMNPMMSELFSLSISYENLGERKKDTSEEMSYLVDYTDEFSNFFEDLLRLDRFAQSAEDELNRNVSEEEESRDDL